MNPTTEISRRKFLGGTLAASSLVGTLKSRARESSAPANTPTRVEPGRRIKIGQIGLGGCGAWIADLFAKHGGYEFHAVADYFPAVSVTAGKKLGVPEERCFSGLSGYKKVIESGVEAIIVLDLPYFYPEQVREAVTAGLHVYMAKPVAVDVPGALSIAESGKIATQQQRVFLVDYQIPTDPSNIEVIKRIAAGGLGQLQTIFSTGKAGGDAFPDPPLNRTIESRLQSLIWCNDTALGGGYHGNFDIHVVDAVMRAVGGRVPVAAHGWSARFREKPNGDSMDSTCVMFDLGDGLIWNHQSVIGTCNGWFSPNGGLVTELQGSAASARLGYQGKAYLRGGAHNFGGGKVENLYTAGAERNISAFHDAVTKGDVSNPTIKPAVDSALACILGREAAARGSRMTMADLIKENKSLEVDLTGLKS